MPHVLHPIARVLPLTFVVSGLRDVIVNGLSLLEQLPTLAGLVAWSSSASASRSGSSAGKKSRHANGGA